MDGDIVIRGGTLIDGTGAPGRPRRRGGGRRAHRGRGGGPAGGPGARRLGPGRGPRVHRHPHPLRRPGVLGPVAHAVVVPRRHDAWSPGTAASPSPPSGPSDVALLARTLQHVEDMSFDTLVGRRPLGRVRDVPAVSRRRRTTGHGAQLRLLRGPHRGAAVRHGRGGLRAGGDARRARPHAGRGGRGHGGRGHGVRHRARRPPTTATAGARCRRGWRTSTSCGPCSCPCATPARAWWPCSRRRDPQPAALRPPAGGGPAHHVDGPAHGEGLPVPREGGGRERRRPGTTGVEVWPQVSCRPLVFQMNLAEPFTLNIRPSFSKLMGLERRASARPPTATRRGGPRPGRSCRAERRRWSPVQLAVGVGGGVGVTSRARRTGASSTSPRSGAARRSTSSSTSRSTTTSKTRFWSVLANDDPDGIAWLLAARQRPARSGRLGRPRVAAVRRLLRHRPARQLGARPRRHAARAGRAQAHGRAGRRVRPVRPGHRRGRQGRRPVRVRPRHASAPGPLRRSDDFPAERGAAHRRRSPSG